MKGRATGRANTALSSSSPFYVPTFPVNYHKPLPQRCATRAGIEAAAAQALSLSIS